MGNCSTANNLFFDKLDRLRVKVELRAGLPSAWRIGDKTGTGENGARGDIAIVRPPNRAPILVAVYLVGSARPSADLDAAFAEIGRIIAVVF